jgi:hypothetical protein
MAAEDVMTKCAREMPRAVQRLLDLGKLMRTGRPHSDRALNEGNL